LEEEEEGRCLRSYPHCPAGFTLTGRPVPKRMRSNAARRGAWLHARIHEKGRPWPEGVGYPWRESLLGLAPTVHVATASGSRPAAGLWTTTTPAGNYSSVHRRPAGRRLPGNIEAGRSGLSRVGAPVSSHKLVPMLPVCPAALGWMHASTCEPTP